MIGELRSNLRQELHVGERLHLALEGAEETHVVVLSEKFLLYRFKNSESVAEKDLDRMSLC